MNLKELELEQKRLAREMSSISDKIRFEKAKPAISNHALLRYMERIKLVDVRALENQILSDEVKGMINAGAKNIKINGMELRISPDKTIVTII